MKNNFKDILKERILVLDGALGTMIQKYGFKENDFRGREFIRHPKSIAGFNDILNITKPSAILEIHEAYLKSGANIITTNTFNSNKISMSDYGLEEIPGLVKRLNKEGASLARKAIKKFESFSGKGIHFVGGSIGPTNRSSSMSPDITDPLERNVTYNELFEAFKCQVEGLIEGGVDILICETFFDTLNLKAALDASNYVMNVTGKKIPIMVSATVSDNTGRVLSGQTLEAYVTSISHYDNVAVIGLNCGFGPDRMKDYVRKINQINSHFTSCHPNAGLPDVTGCYDVTTDEFKESFKHLLEEKLLNIVGGCCGTSPEYTRVLSDLVLNYKPSTPKIKDSKLRLSGLDMLTVSDDDFLIIGERCNVAGSAKFLRLIKEGNFEEATEIAKKQIEKGAKVIDINMDDPLLDAEKEMVKFLRYILAEPDIARVPFMIDSSKWNVIETALQNIQGKGIVNSLSLKEGEDIFIKRAQKVKDLGFSLMVMAFDEKGQADTFERKKDVVERSYHLLIDKCNFSPEDIIFDVNVMTIGTGMKEDAYYAIDFLKAVKWIKDNLPGARTSGGVSNLSFAFRGKNKLREYMHAIFLHHARKSGLDMAITNPDKKVDYEEIPDKIKNSIEDLIFNRDQEAVEKIIDFAMEDLASQEKTITHIEPREVKSIQDTLREDLIKGNLKNLDEHVKIALSEMKDPVKVIEGPLLDGMKTVGDLFGEGKMFLPQVVKTARTMKRAVEILTPYMEESRKNADDKKAGKIIIATVKGDVHDIGKNIVSTVLACNNYEVIDLGIMVPPEKIVETALKEHPDIICLSGLITPSLAEMAETVRQLALAEINVPIMVGGAATSLIHTALKIDPLYSGIVLHMSDAAQNPIAASRLMNLQTREEYLDTIKSKYLELKESVTKKSVLVPFDRVINIVKSKKINDFKSEKPKITIGETIKIDIPLDEVIGLINWKMFFLAWKIQGSYLNSFPFSQDKNSQEKWIKSLDKKDEAKARESLQLYHIASEILQNMKSENIFDGKAAVRFEPVKSDMSNLYIAGTEFPMLRQQREGSDFLSCSDFIGHESDYIGLFAVTSGKGIFDFAKSFEEKGDNYNALIIQTLADRIVEASAEWLQKYVDNFRPISIRPAWGYPMLPDQTLILKTQKFIPYNEIGIELTENGAMFPPASISGLYFSNPEAKYFMVGEIGNDQLKSYAGRRALPVSKVKDILRQI